jgi:protein-L-isoaspartate O-methyltransferase
MLEQLGLGPRSRVLEIGTGTGYNAAIADVLVGPEGSVTSIDIQPDVVEEARARLEMEGHGRVDVRAGDGWDGVADRAPFDAIELTVGAEDISPRWAAQLRDGGTLVLPLWLRAGIQVSIAFRKDGTRFASDSIVRCGFMRMQGEHRGQSSAVKVGNAVALFDGPEPTERISTLLADAPARVDTVAEPPPGWFERVALEEREAVPLTIFEEGSWIDRRGLFDPAAGSLAVVSGNKLLCYGSDSAAELVRERLSRARPFDVTQVSVTAEPTSATASSGDLVRGAWVIERPSFTFDLAEPSAGAGQGGDTDPR